MMATLTVTDFLKEITPARKKSKLKPYQKEIFELREAGCSFQQITDFLKRNGLEVERETVRVFYNKHKNLEVTPPKAKPTLPHEKLKQTKLSEPVVTPAEKKGTDEDDEKPRSQLDDYTPPKWAGDIDVKKLF